MSDFTPFSRHFPQTRLRRNRTNDAVRRLVREQAVSPNDFIYPMFVIDGKNQRETLSNMPDIMRFSPDILVREAKAVYEMGIPAIAIFPKIDSALKDEMGSEAVNPDNLVCRTLDRLKNAVPELMVLCDVALDPYTSHGHDGVRNAKNDIDNDATLDILCEQSLIQAKAGCDSLAPSDMMDGRIGAIRQALEAENLINIRIISYAAKYASAFYAPFRDAVGSDKVLQGDKKTYQMDPANGDEALHEIALDLAEGADMVLVKPGMPCLDIIARASRQFAVPILGYQVSGEYCMLYRNDEPALMMESLMAFKRAGARAVVSYFAKRAVQLL